MSSIAQYHKYRNELLAYFGGLCYYCGTRDNLQFHHNNPDDHGSSAGIGGWQQVSRLRREVRENKDDDIILLCAEHHKLIHEKYNGVME